MRIPKMYDNLGSESLPTPPIFDEVRGTTIAAMGDKKLVIGGDGKADSPGHSAKFGSYTAMELDHNKIIAVELVQSNEVDGSFHMELEGLKRAVKVIQDNGAQIGTLVTDRHVSIAKWVRDNLKEVIHLYDLWHIAKSFRKKLVSASRERNCFILQKLVPSCINHLYWSSSSTLDSNPDLKIAKWLSLLNHVLNKHSGHGELFNECAHGPIEHQKQWIDPGTEPAVKLEKIVSNPTLLKDLRKASGKYRTSALEAYHSLGNHFAPKLTVFSNKGMDSRHRIAAMHYNENGGQEQRIDSDGEFVFGVRFPKYKAGQGILTKVMVPATYEYVDTLMRQVLIYCQERPIIEDEELPVPLADQFDRPEKQTLVREFMSRYDH